MNDHTRRFTTAHWDHRRDERKHDTPSGFATPLFEQNPSASTIAALCQGIPLEASTKLIEQYAEMKCSMARLEEAQRIYERLDRCMVMT